MLRRLLCSEAFCCTRGLRNQVFQTRTASLQVLRHRSHKLELSDRKPLHLSGFHELQLNGKLVRALQELGYERPTEIQQRTIAKALRGYNVSTLNEMARPEIFSQIVASAKTGTGKTAAYMLPAL